MIINFNKIQKVQKVFSLTLIIQEYASNLLINLLLSIIFLLVYASNFIIFIFIIKITIKLLVDKNNFTIITVYL